MLNKQGTNNYYSFAQFTSQIDRSGILYNKLPKDSLSIPFSQIQTINYSNNIQTGEAYIYKNQHSCSFTATCYFSGISILEPGISSDMLSISNDMPSISNDMPSISNDMPSISNDMLSISNDMPSISNDMPSIPNAMPSISNDKDKIFNDRAIISKAGPILPYDRSNLSIDGVYISRNENNISFSQPIQFNTERIKSLKSGITPITKHLTVELNITFNIKLFNYLIYG